MNEELEKLKSLLYTDSLTQYGKRKLIKTYEDIIKEKDKQIDLMAEFISKQDVEEEICIKNKTNPDWCNEDYTNCKDCIKQYYERKSKE